LLQQMGAGQASTQYIYVALLALERRPDAAQGSRRTPRRCGARWWSSPRCIAPAMMPSRPQSLARVTRPRLGSPVAAAGAAQPSPRPRSARGSSRPGTAKSVSRRSRTRCAHHRSVSPPPSHCSLLAYPAVRRTLWHDALQLVLLVRADPLAQDAHQRALFFRSRLRTGRCPLCVPKSVSVRCLLCCRISAERQHAAAAARQLARMDAHDPRDIGLPGARHAANCEPYRLGWRTNDCAGWGASS
jgi:hypothetical protein